MEARGGDAAILEWINSFALPRRCNELTNLADGFLLNHMLSSISPQFFDASSIVHNDGGLWRLSASNLKQISTDLERFYGNELQRHLDLSNVNCDALGKGESCGDIWILLEAIIGAAIFSENGSSYLQVMASLSVETQALLKTLIESVMTKCTPLEADESSNSSNSTGDNTGSSSSSSSSSYASVSENQMMDIIAKIESEKSSLAAYVSNLNAENSELRSALQDSRLKLQEYVDVDIEKVKKTSRNDADMIRQLNMEIADVRRELDLTKFEFEETKQQLAESKKEFQASTEIVTKLSTENENLTDDLEISKDTAAKLSKAEEQIRNYKMKLEEIPNLKRQIKDLSEQLDQYIDKIPERSEENSNISSSMQQLISQYKDKSEKLERENIDVLLAVEGRKAEIEKLKSKIDHSDKQYSVLFNEKSALESEVSSLKAKIEENSKIASSSNVACDSSSIKGDSHDHQIEEKEAVMQSLKKTILDLEMNLQRVNRERDMEAKERAASAFVSQQLKDAQDHLAQANHTSKLLEERLKEKEGSINKLEQDLVKIKNVASSQFKAFKHQCLKHIQDKTAEKQQLEELSKITIERYEANEEKFRKDERLISSAFYELGVKIMDRNINSHLMETSNADMKFLKKASK